MSPEWSSSKCSSSGVDNKNNIQLLTRCWMGGEAPLPGSCCWHDPHPAQKSPKAAPGTNNLPSAPRGSSLWVRESA